MIKRTLGAHLTTLGLLCSGGFAFGKTVTIPAVASLTSPPFASPFFSDVRVFNPSYTVTARVTATYRCFIGSCPSSLPTLTFDLLPRQQRSFDDMIAAAFSAPNTAGGVELATSAAELSATSRLYSTAPTPTVGQFVPGLEESEATPVGVVGQLANASLSATFPRGFRSNVGAYNGNGVSQTVTFSLYSGTGEPIGTYTTPQPVAPGSGFQVNNIFEAVGAGSLSTTNAYCEVRGDGTTPLYAYGAVIDNNTTDPIFVFGRRDEPKPAGLPTADFTFSPASPQASQGVQFSDASGGSPVAWLWDFGDGTTSTSRNATKTFSSPGTYTVVLRVANASGPSVKSKDLFISTAPSATLIKRGTFAGQNGYTTQGTAEVWRNPDGTETLRLAPDFRVSSGAGSISLWLGKSNANVNTSDTSKNVKLGTLPKFAGEMMFAIPAPGLGDFTHVLTFCDAARVNFGFAELRTP